MDPSVVEAFVIAATGGLMVGQSLLVLVLLTAERGLPKAVAYLAGMFAVYLAFGQGTLVLGTRLLAAGPDRGAGVAAGLSLGLGVVLLLVALRTWRRPPGERRGRMLAGLDHASVSQVLGLGALVATFNVKNLGVYLSAVEALTRAGLPLGQGAPLVVAVTGVFCTAVWLPILLRVAGGERARPLLARLRGLLEARQRGLAAGILGFFGVAFVVRGLVLLAP